MNAYKRLDNYLSDLAKAYSVSVEEAMNNISKLTSQEINAIADEIIKEINEGKYSPKTASPTVHVQRPHNQYAWIVPPTVEMDSAPTPKSKGPVCIACGAELDIKFLGRKKYCGKCGCFLPDCVYDQPPEPTPTPGGTYVVKSGDSLWSIASRMLGNGTDYIKIAELNGIPYPYNIYPGQVLKLPTATKR